MANITTVPSGWVYATGNTPTTYITAGNAIPTPIDGDQLQRRSAGSVYTWNMAFLYYTSWTSPIGSKTYTNCWVLRIGAPDDLTGSVTLPSYTSINGKPVIGVFSKPSGENAKFTSVSGFDSSLKYIRFPNVATLTSIGTLPSSLEIFALDGCTNIQTVPAIPASVTTLDTAFQGCTSLRGTITVNCKATSYTDCFKNTTHDILLFGKGNLVPLAKTANNKNVRVYQPIKWKSSI